MRAIFQSWLVTLFLWVSRPGLCSTSFRHTQLAEFPEGDYDLKQTFPVKNRVECLARALPAAISHSPLSHGAVYDSWNKTCTEMVSKHRATESQALKKMYMLEDAKGEAESCQLRF